MRTENQKAGACLARMYFGTGVEKLPYVLNGDQADGFRKEWKRLTDNFVSKSRFLIK